MIHYLRAQGGHTTRPGLFVSASWNTTMHSRAAYIVLLAIALLGLNAPASAGLQEFTEHDDWFDAVGGSANVTTVNFDEFPLTTTITDHYQHLGVTFVGLNFISFGGDDDERGLRMFNGNDIYFSEPITYFGADIRGTVQYEIYSGDTLLFESQLFGSPPSEDFGGITSDVPFDRVHISDPFDSIARFDDMHFGPPIPAPASALPLSMLLLRRRRRRR